MQSSVVFLSDDSGETWRRSEKMTRDASDECEVAEVSDGVIYATMRCRQGRKCRAFSWSRDGGESWSEVAYDPGLPEPSCQGSIVRFDAERILLAHPGRTHECAGPSHNPILKRRRRP